MSFLSKLGKSLKPSETLLVKARANELIREGREVIDL